jgi:DNA-binding response OmpR family regulator
MDTLAQTRVLILEPDPALRALLVAVLRRSGVGAAVCDTEPAAAGECVRRTRFSAVIVSADVLRPDAVLHELRAAAIDGRPIIILTTTAVTGAHGGEADIVLCKPFFLAELETVIAACCRIVARDAGPRRGSGATHEAQT